MELLDLSKLILSNLDAAWTFFLLFMRFAAMMSILPGIGGGQRGVLVRGAAILVFALCSMPAAPRAALPADSFMMAASLGSEFVLGFILGAIPLLVVSGVEGGAHLASVTMGLGAGQLFDPVSNTNTSALERIMGDMTILIFLALGGHHVIIQAVSGMGGTIVPGSFALSESSVSMFMARAGDLFRVAVLVSAPCVAALLLTQFVMGLVSKTVPAVNVMIVSFPLTIGIGLILTLLSLPEISNFTTKLLSGLDVTVLGILKDAAVIANP